MAVMEWDSSLSTGVVSIDDDHRLLISLMAELDDTVRDNEDSTVVGSVLLSLAAYTDYHFAREEKIMTVCGDPAFETHKAYHDRLRASVMTVCLQYESTPEDVDFDDLQVFLRDWLTEHILGEDTKMKPFILANADKVALIGERPLVDLDKIEETALSEDMEWRL